MSTHTVTLERIPITEEEKSWKRTYNHRVFIDGVHRADLRVLSGRNRYLLVEPGTKDEPLIRDARRGRIDSMIFYPLSGVIDAITTMLDMIPSPLEIAERQIARAKRKRKEELHLKRLRRRERVMRAGPSLLKFVRSIANAHEYDDESYPAAARNLLKKLKL